MRKFLIKIKINFIFSQQQQQTTIKIYLNKSFDKKKRSSDTINSVAVVAIGSNSFILSKKDDAVLK